jgi:hypothetical protein
MQLHRARRTDSTEFIDPLNRASDQNLFSEGETWIQYREPRLNNSLKALLITGTAIAVAAAFGMLITATKQTGSAPFYVAVALVFLAFALLILAIALSPPQVLRFDLAERRVHGSVRRRFGLSKRVELDFKQLKLPRVEAHERELGEPLSQVIIELVDGSTLALGAFENSSDAEAWSHRIALALGKQ